MLFVLLKHIYNKTKIHKAKQNTILLIIVYTSYYQYYTIFKNNKQTNYLFSSSFLRIPISTSISLIASFLHSISF